MAMTQEEKRKQITNDLWKYLEDLIRAESREVVIKTPEDRKHDMKVVENAAILLDELLDKQEPVEPVKANRSVGYWCRCGWYFGIRYSGINGSVNYCANCGRKVKWNG